MRIILIVGFSLILSGCPSVTQLKRLPDTTSAPQPIPINRPGPLLHEATGFTFSERYGTFKRVNATRYDTGGLDESFGYHDRRPDCLVAATFYLYPTPRMIFIGASPETVSSIERDWLKNETNRSKAFIEQHFAPKLPVKVGSVTTPVQGLDREGSSLTFRKSGNIEEFRLFVFDRKWFIKYRLTYLESCHTEVNSRLDALFHQLPWANAQ